MDHHDSSSPAFDLHRVATLFRRSLAKDTEIIEKKQITQMTACQDQVDRVVSEVQVSVTTTKTTETFGDVLLSDYVEAYNELNKMFPKLGRLFSFIASDVGDKTRILSEHRSSSVGEKYELVGGMLDYEKNEAKLLEPGHETKHHHHDELPNGSRTLLRLHRALLFVVEFIDCIRRANDHDKMAHLARKAYDDTLAQHHPWLVRKGVHLAVHTLPNRHQLLADLAGAEVPPQEAERVMEETAAAGRTVYETVQNLYERYGLLDLP